MTLQVWDFVSQCLFSFLTFLFILSLSFSYFFIFDIDQISSIYYRQYSEILVMSSACWEVMLTFEIIQETFFPFNLQPSITSLWPEPSKVLPFPLFTYIWRVWSPPTINNGLLISVGSERWQIKSLRNGQKETCGAWVAGIHCQFLD